MIIDQNSIPIALPFNQLNPEEGTRSIRIPLDFSKTGVYTLDLTTVQDKGYFSMLQTIFVDASAATGSTSILDQGSQQTIIAGKNTQGYYPLLAPNPVQLTFSNASGSDFVTLWLINVAIPGVVWVAT